ncbi:nuclear transport factor 2 family protein [Haloferacaceae archaeon DSL9]
MEQVDAVREYYRTIDEDDYESLRALLDPAFVQRRPDRTFETRDAFVAFMRDGRPVTETTHELTEWLTDGPGVAVRGRLLAPDGEPLFAFLDVFSFDDEGRITELATYTG